MNILEEEEMRYKKEEPYSSKPDYEQSEEEKELGVNPFLNEFELPYKMVSKQFVYEKNAFGEEQNVTVEYDYREYTKLYIKPENRKYIASFTAETQALLFWIALEIENNKDYISINKKRYINERGHKNFTKYNDSIKELIKVGLLSRSINDDVYWINPRFFFRGNAMTKFNRYKKRIN